MSQKFKNRIVGYGEEPIDSIQFNSRNWRLHPEFQQNALKGILSEVGIVQNVIINRTTGNLVDGHLRVTLADRNGELTVPATYVELTPDEEAKILATFDPLSGLAGTSQEVLDDLLKDVKTADEAVQQLLDQLAGAEPEVIEPGDGGDEFDATPDEGPTRCQPGDLWLIGGKHRLVCGDCTDALVVERLMGDGHAVLMVTDPPYGVDYDPNWRNEAAEKGLIAYGASSLGVVENDGKANWPDAYSLFSGKAAYVWHAGCHANTVAKDLEDCGFKIVSQIIWAKPTFAISRGDYHWQHEPCWYAVKKNETHNWQGSRSESTLWQIARTDDGFKCSHSTQKPLECMERPIRNNIATGEGVYDPFLGSGTTLIATHRLGRICYGVEISPKYCDVILRRAEAEGLTVERLEGE